LNALKPPPGKREWQLQPIKVHHVVVRQAEAGIREPAEADGTWAEAATREMREWRLQPKKGLVDSLAGRWEMGNA